MNKPQKQTVYLPVNDFNSSERAICTIGIPDLYGDKVIEQEGYFFTPEQLNEYTKSVIKQALETATENTETLLWQNNEDLEIVGNRVAYIVEELKIEQSITNTFEETFKQFEV